MPQGVASVEAVLTKEDIAVILALDAENQRVRKVPLRVLCTPEAFPSLYTNNPNDKTKTFVQPDGKKYRPMSYDAKNEKWTADETRWFKRGKERWFAGSDRWPDGLVVGVTYIETKDAISSNKYTMSLEIHARTKASAKAVAAAVRDLLNGYTGAPSGVTVFGIFSVSESDAHELPQHGEERGIFGVEFELDVWFRQPT